MEFSELFHGKRSVFSPDGNFIACLCGDSVDLRFADSLLKAFRLECGDVVKVVKWSGDSTLLLCQSNRPTLKVFSINSGSCVAQLKQATGYINQISWAADCRTVVFLEPQVFRVSVWNVSNDKNQHIIDYIDNVQPWAKPCVAMSPNGKHLSLVMNRSSLDIEYSSEESKIEDLAKVNDYIAIFSAITWRSEKKIACTGIQRVGGVVWSPNSNVIVTWSIDPQDPVLILCYRSGSVIGRWQPSDKLWPGVSEISFSPSSQFLAIASRNSKVHVVNGVAWCEDLELVHDSFIVNPYCQVYRQSLSAVLENPQYVEVTERPVSISFLSCVGKVARFSKVAWSSGGRYMASCLALAPAVIWIWSAAHSFRLCCIIVSKLPVQDFHWDPVHNIIALVDGQDCVTLWNADKGCLKSVSVCTPISQMLFPGNHLDWRYDGKAIVASSDQNSTLLELSSTDVL